MRTQQTKRTQILKIIFIQIRSSPVFEEYWYDTYGERIKSRNYNTNTTIYTPFSEFMMIVNSSGIYNYTYVYDNNQLVARINPDNSKYYYHPDHLGSTSLITNSSGGVVEETFYLPYGEVFEGGIQEIKLYTGKELDDTGFYYYGARYYDPYTTRFISPDLNLPDIYDPQQLNRYSYVKNNPYTYIDPTGKVVVHFGGYGMGGAGGGIVTSTGIVLSYNPLTGMIEAGTYKKPGVGLVTPTASLGFEGGISPLQESLSEFAGKTLDVGFDIGESVTGGLGMSIPLTEKGPDFSKFIIEGTISPFTDINAPIPASGYGVVSQTSVDKIAEIQGPKLIPNNYLTNILSNLFSNILNSQEGKGKGKQTEEKGKSNKQTKPEDKSKEFYNAINSIGGRRW